ncbi:MAG TPA: TOBE domain-containing protein, partial [Candidatus Competibacteraceae bacterium]|nr:TOBE domain-containing protein [Candidatus Competibacteraceae bacterium]
RVFLMDEPLCNLDAKMRATMRTEIKKLVSELGITTVYVTHDQIEAMAMADRIAVMSRGEMVQIGSPLEIYDQPKARFVAELIGSPPMNLVEATVGSDRRLHAHPQYLADTVAPEQLQRVLNGAIVPGSKILVGVRPEHIRIDADPAASGAEARVELIEPLGQQTNVYLQLGDARLIAITDRPHFHTGDTVRIQVTPDKLHLINEGAHVDVHGSASAAAQLRQGDTRMAAH